MCASHRAVRGLIVELTGYGKHTVTDMEAGMRTFKLATELKIPHLYAVSNKVRTEADREAIETFCQQHSIPIITTIPYDENLIESERKAIAPIDFNPVAPSMQAIGHISDWVLARG